ncbi:type VII secretion AAA-ATPase EccA [Nocardia sp. GAS34]|uniref:type VII secretion AAA-ATPase EccA n=1 Tax=unclassified Nocardia TaxID=2637762 RepID=UPI003D1BE073
MSGNLQAQRVFDAAVLSLGLVVDGRRTTPDRDYARKAFQRASEWDPTMADAWLGRTAAGDITHEVILNLYRSSAALGREQRRLGLPPRQLAGRFVVGAYVDYPLCSAVEVTLAYATSLIGEGEYDEAEQVLDRLAQQRRDRPATEDSAFDDYICAYVRAHLHHTTQRWSDVMTVLAGSAGWTDKYLATGAHVMVGSACAQLGLFGEAIRRLELAESGPIPAARTAATYCRGLCLREQGHEDQARSLFEQVYSEAPDFEANAAALRDPKFRLTLTTREQIAARTNRWDPASAPDPAESERRQQRNSADQLLRHARVELNTQVGLAAVKTQVAKLQSTAMLAKIRADKGLASVPRGQHLAFTGPPGTGKTTVARAVAKIYCGLGILKTDKVVEAKRMDFVGQHLGSTAIKTSALIDTAMDGVLFIDEAYTLIQTGLVGGDAFGQEAIDTLLARMENDRDRLVVIIAGYDGEIERLLAANDGLASRFSKRIRFESYTPDELGEIGRVIAGKRDSTLSDEAMAVLVQACRGLYEQQRTEAGGAARRAIDMAGNGRFIRNVIEMAEEEREFRLTGEGSNLDLHDLDETALMRIEAQDMRRALDEVVGALRL